MIANLTVQSSTETLLKIFGGHMSFSGAIDTPSTGTLIHNTILFTDTSTMLDTIKLIF